MEAHIQRAAENEGQKLTTLTEQVGTKVPSTKCVLTKISWNFLGANFEKGTFLGSSLIHCVKEIRGHVAGFRNNNYCVPCSFFLVGCRQNGDSSQGSFAITRKYCPTLLGCYSVGAPFAFFTTRCLTQLIAF